MLQSSRDGLHQHYRARDEWFDRLEQLRLDPDGPLPVDLQSDAWWKTT